jgi:hypothetical protein
MPYKPETVNERAARKAVVELLQKQFLSKVESLLKHDKALRSELWELSLFLLDDEKAFLADKPIASKLKAFLAEHWKRWEELVAVNPAMRAALISALGAYAEDKRSVIRIALKNKRRVPPEE